MNSKRVIVIRANTLDRSTRATKVINTLTNAGYLTSFLCWDKGFKIQRSEQLEAGDFYREIRLKFKAPWGNKALFFLPVWWCFVFFQLMITKWDIIHATEALSIPPAIIVGKLRRKIVIYEILDVYEDAILLPKVVRTICVNIDKFIMWLSSAVILADDAQIEEFGGIPNSKVVAIYDSPHTISKVDLSHQTNNVFTLFFAGLLFSGKGLNLDKIITAIEDIEDVKIVIAGYGDLVDEIKEWSSKMPDKIQFIGEIHHAEVLERSAKADLLFVLRDSIVPVNKYICGSKVLEAMMCGTPILVNKGTSTANKVREENCGLVVDAKNIEEIKEAIVLLRDNPEMCRELEANGRKAYDERYSWEIMGKRLLDLYEQVLD